MYWIFLIYLRFRKFFYCVIDVFRKLEVVYFVYLICISCDGFRDWVVVDVLFCIDSWYIKSLVFIVSFCRGWELVFINLLIIFML